MSRHQTVTTRHQTARHQTVTTRHQTATTRHQTVTTRHQTATTRHQMDSHDQTPDRQTPDSYNQTPLTYLIFSLQSVHCSSISSTEEVLDGGSWRTPSSTAVTRKELTPDGSYVQGERGDTCSDCHIMKQWRRPH